MQMQTSGKTREASCFLISVVVTGRTDFRPARRLSILPTLNIVMGIMVVVAVHGSIAVLVVDMLTTQTIILLHLQSRLSAYVVL